MQLEQIYCLKQPEIVTEAKEHAFFISSFQMGLPGINCWGVPGACGHIGAVAHNRIRVEVPREHPLRQQGLMPVLPDEFERIAGNVRQSLALSSSAKLLPGTDIGFVHVDYRNVPIASFEWPATNTVIVTQEVCQLLSEHAFTGWEMAPVVVARKRPTTVLPPLYELVITGKGGILVEPPPTVFSTCPVCGRQQTPLIAPEHLEFDPNQWDGSDLMLLPPPLATSIFVTERVKVALDAATLTNYVLVPFDLAKATVIGRIKQEITRQQQKEEQQQRGTDYVQRRIREVSGS